MKKTAIFFTLFCMTLFNKTCSSDVQQYRPVFNNGHLYYNGNKIPFRVTSNILIDNTDPNNPIYYSIAQAAGNHVRINADKSWEFCDKQGNLLDYEPPFTSVE